VQVLVSMSASGNGAYEGVGRPSFPYGSWSGHVNAWNWSCQ
jgi:hypothetical protein